MDSAPDYEKRTKRTNVTVLQNKYNTPELEKALTSLL